MEEVGEEAGWAERTAVADKVKREAELCQQTLGEARKKLNMQDIAGQAARDQLSGKQKVLLLAQEALQKVLQVEDNMVTNQRRNTLCQKTSGRQQS